MTILSTDAEKAKEYREKINALLIPVCALMTKARTNDKFDINFQLGTNPISGLTEVNNLKITKPVEL